MLDALNVFGDRQALDHLPRKMGGKCGLAFCNFLVGPDRAGGDMVQRTHDALDPCLPHVVDRATPLRFLSWDAGTALIAGPFGLRQPDATAPGCSPDIILTPLLGFDRQGGRLGQGAGHYDRAFAALPHAWRIGVAWSVQELGAVPSDPWDVPLHAIATEREWITP